MAFLARAIGPIMANREEEEEEGDRLVLRTFPVTIVAAGGGATTVGLPRDVPTTPPRNASVEVEVLGERKKNVIHDKNITTPYKGGGTTTRRCLVILEVMLVIRVLETKSGMGRTVWRMRRDRRRIKDLVPVCVCISYVSRDTYVRSFPDLGASTTFK